MPRDNYIILVGHNYDEHKLDFAAYAQQRARQAAAETKKGKDIHIQIMDVGAGKTTSISIEWKGGVSTTRVAGTKTHQSVTAASYDRNGKFKENQPGIMSITDFYAAIRSIGGDEPGTLVEASIFSHAYYQGPILVNSDDNLPEQHAPGGLGLRDPNDKDARARKDFFLMGDSQLSLFRGAFTSKGLVWIWGCNMSQELHRLLSVIQRKQPKNLVSGTIELTGLDRELIDTIIGLNSYLAVNIAELRRKFRCTFELTQLRTAIAALIRGTYQYKISSVGKVRTIGALPATYAEKRSLVDPRQLLEIAKHTRKHTTYYISNFGFKLDDEGRGYAVFEPGFIID